MEICCWLEKEGKAMKPKIIIFALIGSERAFKVFTRNITELQRAAEVLKYLFAI